MNTSRKQMIRTVDARLAKLRNLAVHARETPRGGWIKTLRQALGLTAAQLGARLKVTPQAVHELETNESKGSITLASLRRAANAMDAEIIYSIVPRKNLNETLYARARAVAEKRFSTIARSMHLEQQAVDKQELEAQIEDYARELLNRPHELWR
jgi:predicted DNA-binding mobile mystery protein A